MLSHYAPLCPLFSIWKNHKTQPVCRIMSGKHGNNHPSRAKHSQVFSWNVGAKKGIILAAFCICQEWECHRFSRSRTGCRGRGGIRGAIMAVRPILSPLRALLYMGRYFCCLQYKIRDGAGHSSRECACSLHTFCFLLFCLPV